MGEGEMGRHGDTEKGRWGDSQRAVFPIAAFQRVRVSRVSSPNRPIAVLPIAHSPRLPFATALIPV